MTAREDANVIDIFFVLVAIRIKVERSGIGDIPARFVRDDGDVIADFILIRIALKWVECSANSNVRRPGHTSVSAKGIKQLRICVIGGVTRVIPNSIKSSIGRY